MYKLKVTAHEQLHLQIDISSDSSPHANEIKVNVGKKKKVFQVHLIWFNSLLVEKVHRILCTVLFLSQEFKNTFYFSFSVLQHTNCTSGEGARKESKSLNTCTEERRRNSCWKSHPSYWITRQASWELNWQPSVWLCCVLLFSLLFHLLSRSMQLLGSRNQLS